MQRSTLDAEVPSALGRLHRAGDLDAGTVETKLHELAAAPIQRHAVNDLCSAHGRGAIGYRWSTTDHRLRAAPSVDVVVA